MVPAVCSGAVVVVPVCDGKFILLNQFRHALRDFQFAFPRGFGETNIDSAENAEKEAEEELGTRPHDIKYLGQVVADSGMNGNIVDVYTCSVDAEKINIREKYEGIKNAVMLDSQEIKDYIRTGKINDGFTLSAYTLYCNSR